MVPRTQALCGLDDFEQLMRTHNRRLYRVARSMLRDAAEAEDALQEAYLSAYRGLAQFRGDAQLATWLTRIVMHECAARLRKQARRDNVVPIVAMPTVGEGDDAVPVDLGDDSQAPERMLVRAQLRELLERKIDALPLEFRTVFVMRSVEELGVEETADLLGIPEATVRTRHFRARSLLRESIAQEMDMAERDAFGFDGERCDRIVARVRERAGATPQA